MQPSTCKLIASSTAVGAAAKQHVAVADVREPGTRGSCGSATVSEN